MALRAMVEKSKTPVLDLPATGTLLYNITLT
jgi:hypothetical protein